MRHALDAFLQSPKNLLLQIGRPGVKFNLLLRMIGSHPHRQPVANVET